MAYKILLVDDEQEWVDVLEILFKRIGFDVSSATSGIGAWKLLEAQVFDLVLSDLAMPDMSGIDLLKHMRSENNQTPFIIMTGAGAISTAVEAVQCGAYNYITKPFKAQELEILAKRAVEFGLIHRQLEKKNSDDSDKNSSMVFGTNKKLNDALRTIDKLSSSGVSVLITGESGTGKSLFAKHIHATSDRANNAFFTIDCGALPESLLESELFGHVKGAFTGAVNARRGLLEEAQNGTIFLDEIGELTPVMQVKLLRAIQEKEIRPVGGNHTVSINVRFITATNKDLLQEVKEGRFREDLYYRLAVIALHLPPLRERTEDLIAFIWHFVKKFNERYGKNILQVSPATLQILMDQPWQGNIRELANVLERAVLLTEGDTILPYSLGVQTKSISTEITDGTQNISLQQAVRDAEKRTITQALSIAGGNRTQAATLLGIGRRTLYDKLEEYKIS